MMIMDSSSYSPSSSSSKQLPEEFAAEKLKCMVSNCLIIAPFTIPHFIHNPFLPSSSPTISKLPNASSPNNQNLHCLVKTRKPHHFLDELHSSIASTADRFVNFLTVMTSRNPFVTKLFSFHSDFHNFCQIHRRNYVKMNSVPSHNFAAILPGDSVAGVVVANGILNFLNIYNTLLVCRLVLTWFPNSPPAIVSPLSTLCDPYLNIFRGLIPPLGGSLDLSPILAFLVLNALTSTASALPAELPSAGVSQGIPSSQSEVSDLTASQKKWMQRFAANKSKVSNNGN